MTDKVIKTRQFLFLGNILILSSLIGFLMFQPSVPIYFWLIFALAGGIIQLIKLNRMKEEKTFYYKMALLDLCLCLIPCILSILAYYFTSNLTVVIVAIFASIPIYLCEYKLMGKYNDWLVKH